MDPNADTYRMNVGDGKDGVMREERRSERKRMEREEEKRRLRKKRG